MKERRWLRPVGLFALAFGLAVGQPLIMVAVSFSLLTLFTPGGKWWALVLAAVALGLVFAGDPADGLWYVERGWALLVGGAFVALTMAWPERPFLSRAMAALAAGSGAGAMIIVASGGWSTIEILMVNRIRSSVNATLDLVRPLALEGVQPQLAEAVARTAELQGLLFPSLISLSTLASLGVGWWLHCRVAARSDQGLGPVREFRFPDPLIWLFIVGLGLVVAAEWSDAWGRAGTNLMTFMGALYILRGFGVLVFFLGGISVAGGILLLMAMFLAAPLLLVGALVIGMGDSWLDIRARLRRRRSAARD
jgi:hypothetical protein